LNVLYNVELRPGRYIVTKKLRNDAYSNIKSMYKLRNCSHNAVNSKRIGQGQNSKLIGSHPYYILPDAFIRQVAEGVYSPSARTTEAKRVVRGHEPESLVRKIRDNNGRNCTSRRFSVRTDNMHAINSVYVYV